MRKIIVAEFMTIDGVIQNEENDGDGFKYGGWFFPYADEVTGAVVQERLAKPADLLLGRKTFDGWEGYWPTHSRLRASCDDRDSIETYFLLTYTFPFTQNLSGSSASSTA